MKRTMTLALAALVLCITFSAFPHRAVAGSRNAPPAHNTKKADTSSPNLYLIGSAVLAVVLGWRRISRLAGVKEPSN
jgi:hypothetical protein